MVFFRIVRVASFVFRFFKQQTAFNHVFIDAIIRQKSGATKNTITANTLQKIKKYYCLGIPVTCASYKKIYSKNLSESERELATLTGIITPLIDDFTDEKILSNEQISAITSHPERYAASSVEEQIVKNILCDLINRVPSASGFLHALKKTIDAQHLSARQMEPDITEEELLQITLEKGAWSHIFFHYLLNEIPTDDVVKVIGQMGGMLQMSNDIFDVYKDHQEGIKTIPLICKDFSVLEDYYMQECKAFCRMARALPYQKNDVEFFITFIAFVMARGIVALRQLKRLQKSLGGGALPVARLDRKQLICDMEKPVNALKTAWHTYRIVQ